MSWIEDVAFELRAIDSRPRELRRFALVVGGALLAVAAWLAFRRGAAVPGAAVAAAAVALVGTGVAAPRALRPVHRAWMALGLTLGWVVSRTILTALFVLVVTPLGLARRLVARRRPAPATESYWTPRARRRAPDYRKMY